MKICVGLRDDAPPNLRQDNLRSEGRWERQVLEACLQNPHVSEVFTTGSVWKGNSPKYRGSITESAASSAILLNQDWNTSVVNKYRYKAVITNLFAGPWPEQTEEVKSTYRNLNGNLFFTLGFPVMHRQEVVDRNPYSGMVYLEKFIPRSNIILLPVPGAPYVSNESNFERKNLVWAQRLIFMSQLEESATLLWSLKMLEKDSSIHLDILTGWKRNEVKNLIDGQVVFRESIVDDFWNLGKFSPLRHLKDRVNIYLELSWEEVIDKYSKAKLFTTYGRAFGGPPIESGMHGIPFVASGNTGALCDCPNYLYVSSDPYTNNKELEACDTLEKLLTDRELYTKIGNSYRDYVRDNYTYEAFNRNLNKILSDRALL